MYNASALFIFVVLFLQFELSALLLFKEKNFSNHIRRVFYTKLKETLFAFQIWHFYAV